METKKIAMPQQQVLVAYQACHEDEISLLDIWHNLLKNRFLIGGIIFVATMAAIVLAFALPKLYMVEAIVLPPGDNEFVELNIPAIYVIDSNQVYSAFLNNLHSKDVRNLFVKKNQLLEEFKKNTGSKVSDHEVFKSFFDDRIHVISSKNTDFTSTTIRLDGDTPARISQWLDNFITFVDRYTVQELLNVVQSKVRLRKNEISKKIDTLRQNARKERLDKIYQMQEAIVLAKKLNISEYSTLTSASQSNDEGKDIVAPEVDTQMYLRGYKLLQAEMEQLQQRKDDDPYTSGLRELQRELEFLEQHSISPDNIHTVRIDQHAISDDIPVKPKRKLIVVFGFAAGCILAFFTALVRSMVVNCKVAEETS